PAAAGVILASRGNVDVLLTLRMAFLYWFLCCVSHPINDYYDLEADKTGKPKAPLVTGAISLNEAKIIIAINYIIGLILVLIMPPNSASMMFAAFMLAITWAYSAPPFRFAGRGIYGNIFLSGAVLLPFLGGWTAVNGWVIDTILLFIVPMFLFYIVALKTILDMVDVTGDKRSGRKTIPLQIGVERSLEFSVYFTTFAVMSFFAIYLTGIMNIFYIPIGIIAAITSYTALVNLYGDYGRESGRKYSEMFMIPLFLFSFGFMVGGIPLVISPMPPTISFSMILGGTVVSMLVFMVIFYLYTKR
ncbi:MAG: UbiA prenyltransferase family protein, partial [Halobacteriota archaeon]|nr:UbiA prenyltransferase family protein [Halobacteriota archaeon]